jgi:hypothetical protein
VCLAPRREKRSEQTIYDAATRELLQIDFPAHESDFGLGDYDRLSVRFNADCEIDVGSEGCPRLARVRARGNYLRRNSSEISFETERNTSTASAPIMPKAIIVFSDCA